MIFFQKCCALLHKIALKISTYYNRGEIYNPFKGKINLGGQYPTVICKSESCTWTKLKRLDK